jgi:dipeptide/tripeptide permease
MMSKSYVFGSLLTMAAMLYIFTGILYYKDPNHQYKGQLYNFVLGILLLGVVFLPCNTLGTWHYVAAIGFFVGNALVIAFKSSKHDRRINIVVAIMVLLPYLVYFILKTDKPSCYTLFWAEWISLTVISFHFLFESLGTFTIVKEG